MAYISDKLDYIYFDNEAEAKAALENINGIVEWYGTVTLDDIKALLNIDIERSDNKVYWTKTAIRMHTMVGRMHGRWSIYMPIEYIDNRDETEESEDNGEVEPVNPIYINITTSDMDNPADILEVVFDQIIKLRDRDIFVNIY